MRPPSARPVHGRWAFRCGRGQRRASGASIEAISAKMANSIDQNKALQKMYMPVNLVAVCAA
ncbi:MULTISPECIES: hypothetical protein [unclassified Mesorhizobium]|uniref:hypothetical protein n=1 Tax=unclassified Mesorhizobium TaxID=325217 RepID=UPI00112ED44A|nr:MULTISPECIES: hypothetical protein [unclassified Mesorhizobium]TPJ46860.1 hypothetical protein FJ437_11310 [Mesorhizobium sp. B2-6-6]MBZ9998735.1 hypothetical protein [Mesorhizobium sp. B264B2A]MCA0005280.1 hypothetical protein [Mesorhizobium sp. B264B1B]MCA0017217.1 hypothetical protein [Mesorhizobium sp. B264B1A]TPN35364.1 hypothetical protein FJ979_21100 [Mesorhizobium sp. B1-1-6]